MSQDDAQELWALRAGRDPARLAVVRADLDDHPIGPPPPRPRHQTVSLHELHTVGMDGLPERHRTVHVLRAIDPLTRYPYIFDTDAAAVEVIRGGTAGPMYRLPEMGLFGVDIQVDPPLKQGETASLEYLTVFSYRTAPAREFRRGTRERIDNVDIHVTFAPTRLPRYVWWAVWDDHTEREPVHRQAVQLRPDGTVHRFLDSLEQYTVGFQWNW